MTDDCEVTVTDCDSDSEVPILRAVNCKYFGRIEYVAFSQVTRERIPLGFLQLSFFWRGSPTLLIYFYFSVSESSNLRREMDPRLANRTELRMQY